MVPFQSLKLCVQYACCVILSWQLWVRYGNWRNSEIQSVPPDEEESLAHDPDAEESLAHDPFLDHDIFVSHSGAQTAFVRDLYQELRGSYSTCSDITLHSLPRGASIPKRILQAAKKCRLAVVVLSEEFVCSKWPMQELCAFVDAGVEILPLYYKLLPADLEHQGNRKRWEKQWKKYAKRDGKHCIDISKWANALTTLCSRNGVIFDPFTEGEKSYLDRIMSEIHTTLLPAIGFDTCQIRGKDRLCQVILDKFKEMEVVQGCALQPKVSVLGLYGLAGCGKSTLCKCLCNDFRYIYGPSKTMYLEMPSHPSRAEMVHKFKGLLKDLLYLTDFKEWKKLDEVSELERVVSLLKKNQLPSCRVFLVVDNISDQSWELANIILHLGVGQGSKLILVARGLDVLEPILRSLQRGGQFTCESIAFPSINETEAFEILVQTANAGQTLQESEIVIVQDMVQMCSFGNLWLPLVMKVMGAMLLQYEGDLESLGSFLERSWTNVKMHTQETIRTLVLESFKVLDEQLQLLFLDVALFISRLQSHDDEVTALLCVIHGTDTEHIKKMIQDLQRHCFLIVSEENIISVPDVNLDFAKSIHGISQFTKRWCWEAFEIMGPEAERVVVLKQEETKLLRTLILEVGEGCERVDLQGFSCLKAVVLRNCKSLKVLGLEGLSSLVCLTVENCASLQRFECNDESFRNVRKLRVVQTEWEQGDCA